MALQDMKDKMTGPIVWGIVGLLCVVFAVWGIGASPLFGGSDPTLVKVGGAKITQTEYQNAYNRSYQQMLQMMGNNFNPSEIDQSRFRQEVLTDLIDQTLLQQYAGRLGYETSDASIYGYVSQIPEFQDNGQFSPQAYKAALARSGMVPQQFEAQVRQALRVQQLRDSVVATSFVVPKQTAATWAVLHETRDVDEVLFSPSRYAADVKVSDAQVQQYYDAHKSDFIAPQQVKLAYIELSQTAMAAAAKPSSEALKAIYEAQKAQRFTSPAQRQASHILISFNGNEQKARETAEAVERKLAAGGSFAALAKEYSDDAGSKDKGGDLGWLSPGMTEAAFNDALFGLAKVGDVSEPVKTKFGWDIIRLDAERPTHVQPFSDPAVQAKLLETYRSAAGAKEYDTASTRLANLAFENPNSLDPAAKALGLKVQTTDWVTRKGGRDGITAHQAVLEAAFSAEVLKDGENSKPVTIGPSDQVVVRKLAEKPERQLTLAEVKDRVQRELTTEAAAAHAKAAADALVKAVAAGQPLAQAATAAGVKVTSLTGLERTAQKDPTLVTAAFDMPAAAPRGQAPSTTVVRLANGDYAVLVLHSVTQPKAPDGGAQLARVAQGYSQLLAGGEFDAYRADMANIVRVKHEKSPQNDQDDSHLLE
ncbi:MAG TPA: SurA N-terminal domain-containing protein [Nevskiaceae bacterium]